MLIMLPQRCFIMTGEQAWIKLKADFKFTFNTEGYPSATNIRWTFPDGKILTGTEVSYGIPSSGTKQVILTVHLGDKDKSWTIELQIRDYVVNFKDWE